MLPPVLRRAGKDDHLSKASLIALQRAIVDERFASRDYRDFQNYVGESVGVSREIVYFVAPKPEDLPGELDFLASYDRIKRGLQKIVDMPDRRLDLFIRLCLQNKGRLAKGKRGQFDGLTDEEVRAMEKVVEGEMRQPPP